MSNYADIKKNDVANGEGICVSLWLQGCPHRCNGCHNPETWEASLGKPFTKQEEQEILRSIDANNTQRNFAILGGEPLAPYNIDTSIHISELVKDKFPNIKIYIWTGYIFEDLINNEKFKKLLPNIDILVDGLYQKEYKSMNLKLRGSTNQRLINVKETIKNNNNIILYT